MTHETDLFVMLNLIDLEVIKIKESALKCLVNPVQHISNSKDISAYARRGIVERRKWGINSLKRSVRIRWRPSEVQHRVCCNQCGRICTFPRVRARVKVYLLAYERKSEKSYLINLPPTLSYLSRIPGILNERKLRMKKPTSIYGIKCAQTSYASC